jgi:hypothetical protein
MLPTRENPTIILDPFEVDLAAYIAKVRSSNNRDRGIEDKAMAHRIPEKIAVDGMVAEFAVCKYYNVYPDLSSEFKYDRPDCEMYGRTVDVKSTTFGKTSVYLPARKARSAIDRYIWTWVEGRRVWILGWFAPSDLFKEVNLMPSPRPGELHYKIDLNLIRKTI